MGKKKAPQSTESSRRSSVISQLTEEDRTQTQQSSCRSSISEPEELKKRVKPSRVDSVVPRVESDWTEEDKAKPLKSPRSSESEPEELKKRVKPSRVDHVVPGVESDWTEDDKVQTPAQTPEPKRKKLKSPRSSESEPEELKKRVKPSRVDPVVPGVESDWTEEDKIQTPAQTPDMKRKKIKSPLSSQSEPESLKKRVKPSRLDVVIPGVESDW